MKKKDRILIDDAAAILAAEHYPNRHQRRATAAKTAKALRLDVQRGKITKEANK